MQSRSLEMWQVVLSGPTMALSRAAERATIKRYSHT
jgi:hypothetical protein